MSASTRKNIALLVTGLLLVPLLAACGGAAKGGTVDIKLDSYSIIASPASLNAGDITFNVKNIATDGTTHEFVVVDSQEAADALIVGSEGVVPEEEVTVMDEVEDVAPGGTGSLTINLAAGHYILMCNVQGHYALGMHADFEVGP